MPWLTPDEDSEGAIVSRPLHIPAEYTSIVSGALLQLCDLWNWEEFGDITPQEAVDAMRAMVDTYYEGNMMIGACLPYATTTIPNNMLPCDGSQFARADYPALYAILDAAYIVDADTFATPNMVGRFPLGTASAQGTTGGASEITLTVDEIPTHGHTDSGHVHSEIAAVETLFPEGLEAPQLTTYASVIATGTGYANIQNTGGGEAHDNMPPYLGQPWGIIYR